MKEEFKEEERTEVFSWLAKPRWRSWSLTNGGSGGQTRFGLSGSALTINVGSPLRCCKIGSFSCSALRPSCLCLSATLGFWERDVSLAAGPRS